MFTKRLQGFLIVRYIKYLKVAMYVVYLQGARVEDS